MKNVYVFLVVFSIRLTVPEAEPRNPRIRFLWNVKIILVFMMKYVVLRCHFWALCTLLSNLQIHVLLWLCCINQDKPPIVITSFLQSLYKFAAYPLACGLLSLIFMMVVLRWKSIKKKIERETDRERHTNIKIWKYHNTNNIVELSVNFIKYVISNIRNRQRQNKCPHAIIRSSYHALQLTLSLADHLWWWRGQKSSESIIVFYSINCM